MDTVNPFSTYDALFIGNKLESYMEDFNFSEIHLFSYFSCLLSLYDGNPTSFWGYKFIKNDLGVPISNDIQNSLNSLLNNKEIEKNGEYFKLTVSGKENEILFSNLKRFENRKKYLENACDSLLALPIGNIRYAINNDPVIRAINASSVRTLLDSDNEALPLLHDQFAILNKILDKKTYNLFVPAVTWLKYLQLPREATINAE